MASPTEDIRISEPFIDDRTERLVLGVLRSRQLAAGPMVAELERRVAQISDSDHAVALSSGTTALELVLRHTVERGATVITSPFTFVATLNAAVRAGLRVRFADIGDDFNMDAGELESMTRPDVSAVLPVHLYGQPAEMGRIVGLAAANGWTVIEDCAQAIGAKFEGRPVGSFGTGCFSLYATKNVTSGEGGVVTTNDGRLARALRLEANQGMERRYEYEVIGSNHRMTDLQAAVALPQLEDLEALNGARRRNAQILSQILSDTDHVITPIVRPNVDHVFHQYTIRLLETARVSREVFCQRLRLQGVASGIYYPRAVFDYACFKDHPLIEVADVPHARRAAQEVVSLPIHPGLSEAHIQRIGEAIRTALRD